MKIERFLRAFALVVLLAATIPKYIMESAMLTIEYHMAPEKEIDYSRMGEPDFDWNALSEPSEKEKVAMKRNGRLIFDINEWGIWYLNPDNNKPNDWIWLSTKQATVHFENGLFTPIMQ